MTGRGRVVIFLRVWSLAGFLSPVDGSTPMDIETVLIGVSGEGGGERMKLGEEVLGGHGEQRRIRRWA